jgi:MOSC domain-containing protein YiiM/multidrug transporter EmrE-like cation transporter
VPYPASDKTALAEALMSWIVLVLSGVLEAVWATALDRSEGLSRPGPTALFAVTLAASTTGPAYAMRDLPVGTSYAVWVGIGAVLTVGFSMVSGVESTSPLKLLLLAGIVGCVVGLKVLDQVTLFRSPGPGVRPAPLGPERELFAAEIRLRRRRTVDDMKVLSVNVGRPRPNPWKGLTATGIDKRPVDGPVAVTEPGPKGTGAVGLAGDRVYDIQHHGGSDQAVYAYAREDLDRWEREFGRTLPNGCFGENLTTTGIDVNAARIGERWRIGTDVVLEVSCPRIPCVTFHGWLETAGWIKRFTLAAVPGPYFRIVEAGNLCREDPIQVVHRPDHDVTVELAFRALTTEPDLLGRLLAADALPRHSIETINRRLGRG